MNYPTLNVTEAQPSLLQSSKDDLELEKDYELITKLEKSKKSKKSKTKKNRVKKPYNLLSKAKTNIGSQGSSVFKQELLENSIYANFPEGADQWKMGRKKKPRLKKPKKEPAKVSKPSRELTRPALSLRAKKVDNYGIWKRPFLRGKSKQNIDTRMLSGKPGIKIVSGLARNELKRAGGRNFMFRSKEAKTTKKGNLGVLDIVKVNIQAMGSVDGSKESSRKTDFMKKMENWSMSDSDSQRVVEAPKAEETLPGYGDALANTTPAAVFAQNTKKVKKMKIDFSKTANNFKAKSPQKGPNRGSPHGVSDAAKLRIYSSEPKKPKIAKPVKTTLYQIPIVQAPIPPLDDSNSTCTGVFEALNGSKRRPLTPDKYMRFIQKRPQKALKKGRLSKYNLWVYDREARKRLFSHSKSKCNLRSAKQKKPVFLKNGQIWKDRSLDSGRRGGLGVSDPSKSGQNGSKSPKIAKKRIWNYWASQLSPYQKMIIKDQQKLQRAYMETLDTPNPLELSKTSKSILPRNRPKTAQKSKKINIKRYKAALKTQIKQNQAKRDPKNPDYRDIGLIRKLFYQQRKKQSDRFRAKYFVQNQVEMHSNVQKMREQRGIEWKLWKREHYVGKREKRGGKSVKRKEVTDLEDDDFIKDWTLEKKVRRGFCALFYDYD